MVARWVMVSLALMAGLGGCARSGARIAPTAWPRTAALAAAPADGLVKARATCADERACTPVCVRRDAGHAAACTRLGEILAEDGDPKGAHALFVTACKDRDALGCSHLATSKEESRSQEDRAEATLLHERACAAGIGRSCARLGQWERAVTLCAADCDAGSAEECNLHGELIHGGHAGTVDAARATEQFDRACAGGSAAGCDNLARHGTSDAREKACAKGVDACNEVGLRYEFGRDAPEDPAKAATMYAEACERKDGRGCDNLGFLYEHGIGVPARSDEQAATYYATACELDDRTGCFDLGRLYLDGRGVEQSNERAVVYLQKGCGDAEDGPGCRQLAHMYEKGLAVEKDESRASRLYEKSCDEGDGASCMALAQLYAEGRGVKRDGPRAVGLWQAQCGLGAGKACKLVGDAHTTGDIVRVNSDLAAEHYKKGCALDDSGSCKRYHDMTDPMGRARGKGGKGGKGSAGALGKRP